MTPSPESPGREPDARDDLPKGWERYLDGASLRLDRAHLFTVSTRYDDRLRRAYRLRVDDGSWPGWVIADISATTLPAAITEATPLIDAYLKSLPGKLAEVTNPDTEQA